MVASKISAGEPWLRITVKPHHFEFFFRSMPDRGERIWCAYTEIDLTVDEGKGLLNPSRDEKIRGTSQKEGGVRKQTKKEIPAWAFLPCDPDRCPHVYWKV